MGNRKEKITIAAMIAVICIASLAIWAGNFDACPQAPISFDERLRRAALHQASGVSTWAPLTSSNSAWKFAGEPIEFMPAPDGFAKLGATNFINEIREHAGYFDSCRLRESRRAAGTLIEIDCVEPPGSYLRRWGVFVGDATGPGPTVLLVASADYMNSLRVPPIHFCYCSMHPRRLFVAVDPEDVLDTRTLLRELLDAVSADDRSFPPTDRWTRVLDVGPRGEIDPFGSVRLRDADESVE